jgi:Transglutaminase-like superfamily
MLRFVRRMPRLRRLPPREILTTLRVAVVIVVVEVLIRWVSLPRLSRLLGVPVDLRPRQDQREQLPLGELPDRARRQLRCTRRVADAWPFSHGPCLRRALVGGHLLREFKPSVRLGVAATGDELLAHAWLEIDGRPLEAVDRFARFERTPSAG